MYEIRKNKAQKHDFYYKEQNNAHLKDGKKYFKNKNISK
jgi:hypothetical protein